VEEAHTSIPGSTRVIQWYDTGTHRLACGAAGQMNSTKYARGVTCTACLGVVLKVGHADQADAMNRLI
jgi:hypothetical protein